MENTNTRIITFGVFDFFHYGHLKLFKNIKEKYGEQSFLIVCVQDTDCILKYKPQAKVLYSNEKRVEIIRSLKFVDDVKIYKDIDKDIKEIDFDIFVRGEDQCHEGFEKATRWCKENLKRVDILERTKGISSSDIKAIKM